MDCCKETKYNLLLKITDPIQVTKQSFKDKISDDLMEIMNWTKDQAKEAVQFSLLRGHFVLLRETKDPIFELSRKLALKEIPHEVNISRK